MDPTLLGLNAPSGDRGLRSHPHMTDGSWSSRCRACTTLSPLWTAEGCAAGLVTCRVTGVRGWTLQVGRSLEQMYDLPSLGRLHLRGGLEWVAWGIGAAVWQAAPGWHGTSDGPKGRTEMVLGHCLAPRVEGGLLAGFANHSGIGTATRHPLRHVSAPGFTSSAQEEPLRALTPVPCCSGGHTLPS